MYAEAVPPSLHALGRAEHLVRRIGAAGRADILTAQLVPGMFDCGTQLRTVGDFALRATFPLAGRDVPLDGAGDAVSGGPDGIAAALERAAQSIGALPETAFAWAARRRIAHVAGDATLTQRGDVYLRLFALPNLWFHLSMAHGIARREGLEIGKADFDGWHVYEAGFRFVE
jgi:hypothetical protein